MPNTPLEVSGEITQERIKRWSQSEKQHPAGDVTDDGSKIQCCKQQYCIGTWNVTSMNQGKLEVVKQEMPRVNVDILGISELKWTGCCCCCCCFSCVQLCATPETAAHQAPPSLGFSRQKHWSGLPFPSPMHESEK